MPYRDENTIFPDTKTTGSCTVWRLHGNLGFSLFVNLSLAWQKVCVWVCACVCVCVCAMCVVVHSRTPRAILNESLYRRRWQPASFAAVQLVAYTFSRLFFALVSSFYRDSSLWFLQFGSLFIAKFIAAL